MTEPPPIGPWYVHEDAVDDELAPMDISVRAQAGGATEIVLCYMGPGLTNTIEEARAQARLICYCFNEPLK